MVRAWSRKYRNFLKKGQGYAFAIRSRLFPQIETKGALVLPSLVEQKSRSVGPTVIEPLLRSADGVTFGQLPRVLAKGFRPIRD